MAESERSERADGQKRSALTTKLTLFTTPIPCYTPSAMTVRVRFAPSPTGYLHIGGARTALFNWLFARHHGGKFILRIEDTDQKRTIPDAMEEQMAALRWLGLDWDEGPDIGGPFGPYIQSERVALYQQYAQQLLDSGHAYKCFATPEELAEMREEQKAKGLPLGYDRRYRDTPAEEVARLEAAGQEYVIRFKMPLEGETVLPDVIRGDITFDNKQLNDLVLLKADGFPTYHLANVVDDHLMEISHILRADEWINTGPLHLHIYEAFGWQHPIYAHLPVVLSPSGKGKLSKRDQAFQEDGQQVLVQVREYRDSGFLPEAVVNFISNVGWSFGDDTEMYTVTESIPRFDITGINPSPTNLPFSKLEWLNGQYIQQMSPVDLAKALRPFLEAAGYEVNMEALLAIAPAINVRLKQLTEAVEKLEFLFKDELDPVTVADITHKQLPRENALAAFRAARELIAGLPELTVETLADGLRQIGEKNTTSGKAGPFLGTLRFGITGQAVSPPLFESIVALGRARTLARLDELIGLLAG
ncbi:MAG: glutamate--tRNA ligase [Anaerolineales bacterium]|nr:glutamate--tRNA ligase [Anaerolineales bacterium]